jgi:hypothetical protein
MAVKFIQISCRESKRIDPRQAKAVLKHKPDIIIFEYPQENKTPDTIFNKYLPDKKPKKEVEKIIKMFKMAGKQYPWVLSDIKVFKNIQKLWSQGKQVYLYFIDAPREITSHRLDEHSKSSKPFPKIEKYEWWWKQMEDREKYMAKHLKWVLKKHKNQNPKILVFLEKFHWVHVKSLLKI